MGENNQEGVSNKQSRISELFSVIFCFVGLFLVGYGIFGLTQVISAINDSGVIQALLLSLIYIVLGIFFIKLLYSLAWNKNNIKRSIINIIIVLVSGVIICYGLMYFVFRDGWF